MAKSKKKAVKKTKKKKATKRKPVKRVKCKAKTNSGKACKKYAVGKGKYCESHK